LAQLSSKKDKGYIFLGDFPKVDIEDRENWLEIQDAALRDMAASISCGVSIRLKYKVLL
jgi:hypothetical protein